MTTTLEQPEAPSPPAHHPQAAFGLLCGLGAYVSWGIVPIYFKQIAHVPPMVVLAHRIVWSILLLVLLIALQRNRWRELIAALRSRRTMLLLTGSTLVLSVNWFTFIWAVANKQVIAASLGYFINPLVAVMLGVIFLRERMRVAQVIAIAIATAAVLTIIIVERRVPIVALTLAFSFGIYGLLRKVAVVAPLVGLLIETALLFPLALAYACHESSAATSDARTFALLMLAGVVTAIPLLWFAAAARRLRLSTLGFLQYISPTGQFLIGRLVYHEPLDQTRLLGFAFVWLALAIFTVDSWRAYRRVRFERAGEPGYSCPVRTRSSVG